MEEVTEDEAQACLDEAREKFAGICASFMQHEMKHGADSVEAIHALAFFCLGSPMSSFMMDDSIKDERKLKLIAEIKLLYTSVVNTLTEQAVKDVKDGLRAADFAPQANGYTIQ